MKHVNNIFTIALVLIGLTFAGCEKMELTNPQNIEKSTIAEIPKFQTVEGVMVFKNSEDFLKALSFVSKMTIEEYNDWLAKNNFISAESIFYEIMNAEADLTKISKH